MGTALHRGSAECVVVKSVCTVVLDTSCTDQSNSLSCTPQGVGTVLANNIERVGAPAADARWLLAWHIQGLVYNRHFSSITERVLQLSLSRHRLKHIPTD